MAQGICPQCGSFSPGKFCPVCGAPVEQSPPMPVHPPAADTPPVSAPANMPADPIPADPLPSGDSQAPANPKAPQASVKHLEPQASVQRLMPPPPPPPMWSTAKPQGYPAEAKNNKKPARLAAILLVLVIAVTGGIILSRRKPADTPNHTQPLQAAAPLTSPDDIPAGSSFALTGGSGIDALNRSMLGLYVTAGDSYYTSIHGAVQNQDGTVLYSQPLYYMNETNGTLYGINAKGEIIRVQADGSAEAVRPPGTPASLIAGDGALYFIEDGLRRMDTSGGNETVLADNLRDAYFDLVEDYLYYIAADDTLQRIPADGGEAQALTAAFIDRFCIDDGTIYFTLLGDSTLWKLTGDGAHTLVSTAMASMALPRFAVSDGALYFTRSDEPVYRCALEDGEVTVASPGTSGIFYLVEDGAISISEPPPASESLLSDTD